MEKYRSTADLSTGIHPFIPAEDRAPLLQTLFCFGILGPVRILAFLIGMLWTAILLAFASAIALASGPIARPFYRLAHGVGLRGVLFALGVWTVRDPVLGVPRTRDGVSGRHPTHGDVVFSNHASYLDPLYLACVYSPVFVLVRKGGVCIVTSLYAATMASLLPGRVPEETEKLKSATLAEICATAATHTAGPVVVFAEGTTTNGKGVLTFAVSAKHVRSRVNLFALGLSYSSSRSETHTIGSPVKHVLGRLGSLNSEIRARIVRVPEDGDTQRAVADQARAAPLRLSADARKRFEKDWADNAKVKRRHIANGHR